MRATDKKRFWAKLDTSPGEYGCWPWTGSIRPTGYGEFRVSHKTRLAHRVAWELHNGPIPVPDMACVLHTCDNPPCCNPAHLFLGTRADNHADCVRKGRHARGEKNAVKLNEVAVRVIRWCVAHGTAQSEVARGYRVHPSLVSRIAARKLWAHIDTVELV